jgi:NAD(P)H-hydrate epimerase
MNNSKEATLIAILQNIRALDPNNIQHGPNSSALSLVEAVKSDGELNQKDIDELVFNITMDQGLAGNPEQIFQKNIYLLQETDVADLFLPRKNHSHKGNYGYVAVVGGSVEYAGATKLANMSAAALRAGCGVVTLAVPASIVNSVSPYLLESTLLPIPAGADGKMLYTPEILNSLLSRYASIAVGMGWGSSETYKEILSHLLKNAKQPLIIDADGLNTLAKMDLSILKNAKASVILTPHLMEFSRLSGISIEQIEADPIPCAKAFAKEYGVTLLLKGCCTVVTDGEVVYLSNRGSAGMATAGSGDVLAGILAGLCGYLPANALTVAAGAYLAGVAGELAEQTQGAVSMLASDTVSQISNALKVLTVSP